MGKFIDLTGQRFGRLTVIERAENSKHKKARWKCLCDCGGVIVVEALLLKQEKTKSCGCYRREYARTHHPTRIIHGEYNTRLYILWSRMRARCHDSKNIRYGGRGIAVCEEWEASFEAFRDWALANGYQDDLSIDRKDNDGPYSPDNCRWATAKEQANNRSSNTVITYNNESHTISEWSEIIGVRSDTLRLRLKAGWSIEEALSSR